MLFYRERKRFGFEVFEVRGLRLRGLCLGYRFSRFGVSVSRFVFRVWVRGSGFSGSRFGFWFSIDGCRFGVPGRGFKFRVGGSGFRVWGIGVFGVSR